MHVETREGRTRTTRSGTRLVEFGKGCEVDVEIPSVAEWALMSPGLGATLKESCDGHLYFAPLPRGFGASLVL